MPNKSDFTGTDTSDSQECYYSTLLHELGHWTGHKDRLNRNLNNRFGNQAYAFEELVAELSAVFSCARLGITLEPRVDNAKYLNGWKSMLRDDAKAIQKACALAQKATDYILQYDQVKDKKVA
jgi:antirestriction protein ArdC